MEDIEVSREEALKMFADQKFKTELIEDLPEDELITIYTTGDDFVDLCRGPHVENSRELLGAAFKIAAFRADEIVRRKRSSFRALTSSREGGDCPERFHYSLLSNVGRGFCLHKTVNCVFKFRMRQIVFEFLRDPASQVLAIHYFVRQFFSSIGKAYYIFKVRAG